MPHPIIRFENVKKGYMDHIVLKGITLDINLGEIFGLIGSSGAGKTTFLNILVGFIKPDDGEVMIRVDEVINPEISDSEFKSIYSNTNAIKKVFGYASQNPSFYLNLTVQENLNYFGCLHNVPKEVIRSNSELLLNMIGLSSFTKTLGKNLSGGMQRRLDIACALIHDPRILILDEPTADLDPLLASQIWRMIKKINRKGTTVIVSSHHILDLEDVCTRIGFLKKGKMVHFGTIQELSRKFSTTQEIHIESYPGTYDKIMSDLKSSLIFKMENRGHEMVISTKKPEILLPKILEKLKKHDETLMDMKINSLSLDELFAREIKSK
ncbi:MAG: ABC transporter ATP-binding protein [Nanoarchaeota archaeon]|nr:ABC transporter ATP-binding protein [Nanoarchaeota archaeon]